MSILNNVVDEMQPTRGKIDINNKAESMVRFLRSSDVSLVDCMRVIAQMGAIIEGDTEWVISSEHNDTPST